MTTYYVGDLCYVLNSNEWAIVCTYDDFYPTEDPEDCDPEGYLAPEEFDLEVEGSGRPFFILKTAYGDGVYTGSDGKDYSCDSGTLGCIAVDDIREQNLLKEALDKGLGHLHQWDSFYAGSCGYDGDNTGILYFHDLDIPT